MTIERISFSSESQYNAIELAIHLGRYSIVQKLCQGLDVLDVACGEGYGSYAMASFWDAKSVTGVDISEEAINTARYIFPHPNVKYIAASAEDIDKMFKPESFDLVISLETIEHVNDPEKFLSAIKSVLKPNGIVVLSCPNDHWYYGPGESENPFHLRTYYFNEFREQAEKHFEKANSYLFGRPINGFGNFSATLDNYKASSKTMTEELNNTRTIQVNAVNTDQPVSAEDCSYFIGIWGNLPVKNEELDNCVLYPISMDSFSTQTDETKTNIQNIKKWNEELQTAFRNAETRISELEKWTTELQGVWRNAESRVAELDKWTEELQSNLLEAITKLAEESKQKQFAQSEIERLQQELKTVRHIIKSMEASKFWKLRNHWVNVKNSLPTNSKEK